MPYSAAKKYLLPQKIRSTYRRKPCSFIIRNRLQHCKVFKNTYFEKIVGTATSASENQHLSDKFRSSHPAVFCKKGVLRNFAKFTGKYLCQSLFFNKVAGLRLWYRCFFHKTPLVAASATLPKGGNFWLFLSF